jgi:hypothetical protein
MSRTAHRRIAVGLIVVAALGYPAVVVLGGGPRFPSTAECASRAHPGETRKVEIVYGRFDTRQEADELLAKVVGTGFVGTEVDTDGCGRFKVVYHGIETYEQGVGTVTEAENAGFAPHIEVSS